MRLTNMIAVGLLSTMTFFACGSETPAPVENLHQWLVTESMNAAVANPVQVQLTEAETASLLNAPDSGRLLVGVEKPVAKDVRFNRTGSVTVRSQGATAIRLHFTGFDLPPRSELYVYSENGEAFGPYTGKGPQGSGEFWSHTISGEQAKILLHHNGPAGQIVESGFAIQDIGHLGPKFLLPFLQQAHPERTLCSFNAPCIEDAACYSNSITQVAQDAIAHILFKSGRYWYICTGGLLADTDPQTDIPYLLTANHCLSSEREADTLEAYFKFRTTSCGGACYDPVGVVPRTMGSSIKSTNSTGDYTLLQLDQPAPAGSTFLEWNAEAVAYSQGVQLYRVSHPQGAPQAYSEHEVDANTGTCSSWPRGSWIYSHDTLGGTEGGSSGSPVLNGAGQVVGQLSGGCGYNVSDPCDAQSNSTVDGALASYFSEVEAFLDPTPCVPAYENCSDGTDNDCDGLADCDDPDCSGDPACQSSCMPSGGYCAANSDCCSNRCNRKKNKCK